MSLRPTPATNETAGPFRKVVGTAERSVTYPATRVVPGVVAPGLVASTRRWTVEVLECGHDGRITNPYRAVTRRRCWRCAR